MKNDLPENRQIYLACISGPEVERKIKLGPLSMALHQGIKLPDYGAGLRRYYCTFLILSPEEEQHIPFEDYEAEDKEADVAVVIPFSEVQHASTAEVIALLEKAFLEGIDALATLSIPDFDTAAFQRDVEAVFQRGDWHKVPE